MIGALLVKIAFVTCLISVLAYIQHLRRGEENVLKIARWFYHSTVITILLFSATLLYLILTHQFQYTYIWSYSSRELSTPLLISTFYAGQEGSFTLWLLYTSIIGVFLLRYSSRKGYESEVMPVFGLIVQMLLLLIVVKSPFTFVWETWPGEVQAGFVPANGRGLNPLLQNYWMVIHPQVLFSGFSAMGVPYAYAVAALLKRDYKNWIRPATPWIVFGALMLGIGIIMGGYWAYETLGWGGYWAWDPVENSSLVPWLFSVASIHTILSQRKSGAFIRTNLVLGMLCFLTVLYSTFLTRSGVLGDTSVHSFVTPGMWVYWLMIGMLVLFTSLGLGLLIRRMKEMPKVPVLHDYYSREFALFLGSATLVVIAVFITVGTSSPIITEILQGKKSAVDISFYSKTVLPLGILIGILTGIAQLLWWTKSDKKEFFTSLLWPTVLSLATTAFLVTLRVHDVRLALFIFGSSFALFSNIQVGSRIVKGNPKYAGGAIAHVGLAVMFFGFVSSSEYDSKQTVSLTQNEPVEALGYTLTYNGYKPIDDEKYAFQIKIEKDGKEYHASPIMYYSKFNEGLMRNPDVINLKTKDFYVAPLSLESASDAEKKSTATFQMKKGDTATMGSMEITFNEFDFPVMEKAAMLEGRKVTIGAKLTVKEYGKNPEELKPSKVMENGAATDQPARYNDRYEFTIASMQPDRDNKDNSKVEIAVKDLMAASVQKAKGDVLVVEASVKPFINLVWSGVIILFLGLGVTIVRRAQEARLKHENTA
ncbi:MAG TPA: cytochrome c-type biogenesis CcmF C-terminal domain-containing protein [Bacteroidota bacterium]|jgi:cytochrome c-type biogenesis protein CcmF